MDIGAREVDEAGWKVGRLGGFLGHFLKEAAGRFSKITALEAIEAAVMIVEALLINSS